MATLGIPYIFEDTTGLATGPSDFLDIYDRPPFLRLSTSHPHSPASVSQSRATTERREGRTLKIFELGARTFTSSQTHSHDGTSPSAILSLDGGRGISGSVKFRGKTGVALERWLKKSSTFGSTLTRQFKASDGGYYQWSFRNWQGHEWACLQLGTSNLVAYYDVKPSPEPTYHASGNVLTIQENYVSLAVEFLSSLIVMRHIHTQYSC